MLVMSSVGDVVMNLSGSNANNSVVSEMKSLRNSVNAEVVTFAIRFMCRSRYSKSKRLRRLFWLYE